ncbi:MAG: MoaD/ThiS family protein [Candidatus Nanopelagicales bacterium]|jgi:molybdopterin synthase sulfur carrier subunit
MVGDSRPVEVHLFAAARAAAGVAVVAVGPGSLADVLAQAVQMHPGLEAVLPRCSTLVDGLAATEDDVDVPAGGRVDVLPPFAGG